MEIGSALTQLIRRPAIFYEWPWMLLAKAVAGHIPGF